MLAERVRVQNMEVHKSKSGVVVLVQRCGDMF